MCGRSPFSAPAPHAQLIGTLIRHGSDVPAELAERSRGRLLGLLLDSLRGGGTPLPGGRLSIALSTPDLLDAPADPEPPDTHHPTP